jgi:hypothetical protein
MKRILFYSLAALILTSCHSKKEKLELNLTKGHIYNQKMVANMSIMETLNGQQMNMMMTIAGKMTFKVLDIQNSVYDMEVLYKSLSMKMSTPNGLMEFNSEKQDEKDIFSSIMKCLIDKPILIKMTKTGKIKEVKNTKSVFASMFEKFPQLSEAQKQQILDQISKAYGDKALKGNLEMCSAIFPDSMVAKGDLWKVKTRLESSMEADIESTYKLTETNDSYCHISGVSKFDTAEKGAFANINGMQMKYDLKGTMSSEIRIDRKSGWTEEGKITQTMKGTAYVKDSSQMSGGMTIPMTITNEMTIIE